MASHRGSATTGGIYNSPANSVSTVATPNVPVVATGIEFGPSDRSKLNEQERTRYEHCYRKLKLFREQLPSHLLSKLPSPQLKELATSLVDGTVFEIVRELEDIQKLTERSLLKKRMEVVNRQKSRKVELTKSQHHELLSAEANKPHTVPLVKKKHETECAELEKQLADEMRSTDKKIILELDQLVADQQSTMQQCAVPMFSVTNSPQEVHLQMHLLRFLQKMSTAFAAQQNSQVLTD